MTPTPMTPEDKEWIDNASYETLLMVWRHAPLGDSKLMGITGTYFSMVMKEKKELVDHVAVSKRVGWSPNSKYDIGKLGE